MSDQGTPPALNHATLHYQLLKATIERGFAPSVAELAVYFDRSEEDLKNALQALQEYHGVVLHPHNSEVWVVHPFSMAPTNFVVRKDDKAWWGNCAWCSFGAAALLGGKVSVETVLGANGRHVTLRIEDDRLLDTDYVVHFPVRMVDSWNNVVYTCSTMLLFEDEAAVDAWSVRHNIAKGDIQPAAHVFDFARVWYGNHLDPDWQKWTQEEAQELFDRFELKGPIWALSGSSERF